MLRTIAVVMSMDDAAFAARMKADGVLLDEFAAKSEKSSMVIQSAARNNVDARMKEQGSLVSLRDTYIAMSDAAVKGSAEQVTAAKLAAEANAKLAASGLEVKAGTSAANDALGLLSTLGVKVGGSGGVASTAIKGITADAGAMSLGVTAAAGAAVIGFGLLAASGVSAYTHLGDQTRILQGVTGATAEDASKLIFVFNQIGTNADTLTLSFARFGKNINDMPQKFEALGVSIAHTSTGAADVFGTFENLKKTFDSTGDAATRDAIVMDLLGRGAAGLVPYLRLSAEELKHFNEEASALGLVMSGSDVEATRQFGIATSELHSSLSALGIMVGREVLPVLTSFASAAVTGFRVVGEGVGAVSDATNHYSLLSRGLHDLSNAALITVTGGLAAIPLALHKSTSESQQNDAAVSALVKGYSTLGVSLSDLDAKQIIANKSQQQLFQAYTAFDTKMNQTAASVGLSTDAMKTDIGVFGAVAPEDFQKVEDAATKMAAAVNAGVQAASGSFSKDFSATSYFSASSIASRESAASSAAKSANSTITADNRVADAEQHVADLTEQYADQAAKAKQDYADKVTANTQKVADAEQALADTTDSTTQRISDASANLADTIASNDQKVADADQKLADDRISSAQSVADAQKRLEDDRKSGAQSVADAQQKLADDEQRQALSRNPAALKRLNDQITLRDAHEAVSKAQEAAASKEQSDLDAIGKAQEAQIKTLAADQKSADTARLDQLKAVEKAQDELDKARVDASRQVQKAEEAVAKARDEQNKLAVEGLTVGQETKQQQVEMRKAIEAVGTAQRTVAADAIKSTGQVSDAIGVTVDDVKKFYTDSTAQAQTFEAGIHEAIAKGYDPGFIADLLKEGPDQAAPIIEAIVNDHDGTLRNIVNSGEKAIADLSQQNIEVAHATFIATTSQNAQTRAEFHNAMAILEDEAATGGTLTANALADKLGLRVQDVQQIAHDYGIALADGINPVLSGIGADSIAYSPDKPLTYDPSSYTYRAAGGMIPGTGSGDIVPAMLEPGEFVVRKDVVAGMGADYFHAINAQHFATGGFVSASDVPPVPDYSAYGSALGYGADQADQYARAKVIAYLNGAGSRSGGSGGPPSAVPSGQVADWVAAGVALSGHPGWWVSPEVNIAMFESGGDPNAINLWDCLTINALILTRRGLLKHDEVKVGDETVGYNWKTGRSEWTPITRVFHYQNAPLVRLSNSRWSTTTTPNHRWVNFPRVSPPKPDLPDQCPLCTWPNSAPVERLTVCPECGWLPKAPGGVPLHRSLKHGIAGSKPSKDKFRRRGHGSERGVEIHMAKAHGVKATSQQSEYAATPSWTTTSDINSRSRILLAAPADTTSSLNITVQEAAILGWIAGDGHVEKYSDKPRGRKQPSMSIAQSKPPMVAKLRALLADIPHAEYKDERLTRMGRKPCGPRYQFRLDYRYAQDLLARAGHPKKDAVAQVLAMSTEQREAWFQGVVDAEGSQNMQPGYSKPHVTVSQTLGPVHDAIGLAAYLEGHRPRVLAALRGHDSWTDCDDVALNNPIITGASLQREDAGTGEVWCVTTELGSWTADDNGHMFLTGNSNAAAGTPSKGLMQVIDPTFRAYMVPNHGDIWNPIDNVAAASNYIASRYGDPSQTPGERSLARGGSYQGYEFGGLVEALGGLHVASHDNGGYLEPGWNLGWNGLGVREPVGVTASGPGIDYDRLGKAIASALAPMVGGDINVSNIIQGSVLGSHAQLADAIAEPLRAISKERARGTTGGYFS